MPATDTTPTTASTTARLPPRWFIRSAWLVHRALVRFTGKRVGLGPPKPGGRFGTLRLTSIGRTSGKTRQAVLGYVEDGPNLVTLAMNGWGDPEPKWWLNLQAQPEATIETADGTRRIRARAAHGEERTRLWDLLSKASGFGDLEAYARRRSRETAVVVMEPYG
jgi:deazaflavin-dependent oxidoreductase (nitroreductase family)